MLHTMIVYTIIVLYLSALLIMAAKGATALIKQCTTGRDALDAASYDALGATMTNPLNGKRVHS